MLGKSLFSITSAITVFRVKFSTKSISETTLNRKQTKSKKKQNVGSGSESTSVTEWTEQQKRIISAVEEGKSVFISGSAGTGKTFLVKHIIKLLRKRYKPSRVYATGSTGVAACALNGQTLHSFSGVGVSNPVGELETVLDRVFLSVRAHKRWLKAKALIIDEISMVGGEFFEILERVARAIRGVDSPWGGIQLVVSGDFFQLPPVLSNEGGLECGKEFAFEADCWDSSFGLQVELERIFRQSDLKIVELLEGMRRGKCDLEGLRILKEKCFAPVPDSSVVELYPRNREVMRVNTERMRRLNKRVINFRALDTGKESWIREFKKGMVPDEVSLCEGARVMLIKNLDIRRKLVNGAIGTVVEFHDRNRDDATRVDEGFREVCGHDLVPIVEFDNGSTMVIEPETWIVEDGDEVVAERKQIPLILAWSLSIHKCQGMTLDRLRTNLSKAFGYGMVYVALSRVSSLEGLYLTGFDPSKIKAHPKVVQFYENLAKQQGQNGVNEVVELKENSEGSQYRFSLSEFLLSRQMK